MSHLITRYQNTPDQIKIELQTIHFNTEFFMIVPSTLPYDIVQYLSTSQS